MVAAATSLCLAFSGNASTISYTNSIGLSLDDWTNTVPVIQFNPGYGTLQSIQFTVQSGFSTYLTIDNNSSTDSSGESFTQLNQYLLDGSYHLFNSSPVLSYISSDFSYSLSGNQSTNSGLLTASAQATGNLITDNQTLADFVGGGFVDLTSYTFTRTFLSNSGGNTAASQSTTSYFTTIVTYTYVPEPSVMAMGGLGLLLLAFRFRRFGVRQF